ncbi:MAG: uridine phosphorylase [Deltaproteobacteria bacterium]|nr:uridine phosphorylase [Deltaproteobacteria bacterium]PWB63275.1 MAG: uridine phosphorylase [Deltaproteobacteria bacterium]
MAEAPRIPLLEHETAETAVFTPANLLAAARIKKGLPRGLVPAGCLLDFDGELVEHLAAAGKAAEDPAWPCFHTRLFRWRDERREFGVIGGTIGASYAVLVAEELFASGCKAIVSVSSAGLVADHITPPIFLLIEKALRDEGTSHHYLPPGRYAEADPLLVSTVRKRLGGMSVPVLVGASWTTDAPFRETERLIASRRMEGIVSVEMEAAALLALGKALDKPVACLAHITNSMATRPGDFEKGGDTGIRDSLSVCSAALEAALEHAGENIRRRKGPSHQRGR